SILQRALQGQSNEGAEVQNLYASNSQEEGGDRQYISLPLSDCSPCSHRITKTRMAAGNSSVTEFILAGLTDQPGLLLPLFFLFLSFYMVTVMGNLGLITLIGLNSHLHTPMYFFLYNLSFIDFCYSTVITPKMLMSFISKKNVISYEGCMTQLFFFLFFVVSESFILSAMAYDRYVAICNPLVYTTTMSPQVCLLLLLGVYVMGFAGAMAHTACMLRLTFCANNLVDHYMCDILPLLERSCSSTYINELVVFVVVGIDIGVPTVTIFISYALILSSILRIRSTEGRSKAFSTCSSHIIAVSFFFGSGAFMYLKPSSLLPMNQGKVSSLFYTIVVPMLNPLIYSLRNKDVKDLCVYCGGQLNLITFIGLNSSLPTLISTHVSELEFSIVVGMVITIPNISISITCAFLHFGKVQSLQYMRLPYCCFCGSGTFTFLRTSLQDIWT
ncbi:Olfactory receptor 145, partial [Galemys pyrenaicus]